MKTIIKIQVLLTLVSSLVMNNSFGQIVFIPDNNLKQCLLSNPILNPDMINELYETDAINFTGGISCTGMGISDLTGLEYLVNATTLNFNNNNLVEIDVTHMESLISLSCNNNSLTSLNMANGNNSNFLGMSAINNPNLTCIQVDDPNYSTQNWTNIDAQTSFNQDCSNQGGGNTSDIEEQEVSFSIVPNPTSGMVKIDTDVEISSVEIFSTSGQQVASFDTKEFDISSLQSGVYFVKVLSDSGLFTTKIIRE